MSPCIRDGGEKNHIPEYFLDNVLCLDSIGWEFGKEANLDSGKIIPC